MKKNLLFVTFLTITFPTALLAQAPYSISTDKNVVCSNQTATLTFTGCKGNIIWSNNQTGSSIQVMAGTYSATCNEAGVISTSNKLTIYDNQSRFKANIVLKSVGCDSSAVLQITNCAGASRIVWSYLTLENPSYSQIYSTTDSVIVSKSANYNAVCHYNFCTDSDSSDHVIFDSKALMTPKITASDTVLCPNQKATLTATGCVGILKWNTGETTNQITISQSGAYQISCTNNCGESHSDFLIVTQKNILAAPPLANFTYSICNGSSVTLYTSCGTGNLVWSNGATSTQITIYQEGTYSAICSNICGNSPQSSLATVVKCSPCIVKNICVPISIQKITQNEAGTIYFGSFDGSDGIFYAIDMQNHSPKWTFKTTGLIQSSPAVSNNIAYFSSNDGTFHALDIKDGSQKWSFKTDNAIVSTPIVVNNIVYFGGFDNYIYALDAMTGQSKWSFKTDGTIVSSPTFQDGVIFIGSAALNNTKGKLYALNAVTGIQKWAFPTDGIIYSSPATNNGVVFVGCDDSYLYAIDTQTGVKKWSYKNVARIGNSSPTIKNGIVYIADNGLNAIDEQTGVLKWNYPVSEGINSSPIVNNGSVYFVSFTKLFSVDAQSGVLNWLFSLPTGTFTESSPVVLNNTIYLGGGDSNFYAIDALTGNSKWSYKTTGSIYGSPCIISNGTVYNSGISGSQN